MKATTFLEIHDCLINRESLMQCDEEHTRLYNGLCNINWKKGNLEYSNKVFKDYFVPPTSLKKRLAQGYTLNAYWADENNDWGEVYNSLRENIILLCAAINGELDNLKE